MRIQKPKRIQKGDVIGLISPASTPEDLSKIEKSVKYFEKNSFKVEVGKNVGQYYGYLAGTDDERLSDLHSMFANKNVKAIFCLRGGFGSPRLLDKINYKLIQKNPKIFVGYSDITALQMAFLEKAGLITFGGPMPAVDFVDPISTYTEEMFWTLVTTNKKIGKVKLADEMKIRTLTKGTAAGRLVGGNLSLINSLVGTSFLPNMKDKILLLEDIGEMPYKIDRMLNHLRLAKIFQQIKSVLIGRFAECYENDPAKRSLTLGEVMDHYFGQLGKPVVYNFPHGHIADKLTVPFGAIIRINATKGFVEYTENAVS